MILVTATLAWASLSHAQTVVMQDDFNYKTPDIDGHSPTKGVEPWKAYNNDGIISTDGTQAIVVTNGGKAGAGVAKATYPFDIAKNTIYTLSITYKFKPLAEKLDCWGGFGFQKLGAPDNPDQPWILIRPNTDGADGGVAAFKGSEGNPPIGGMQISTSDMSVPVKAKIVWNSGTGEVQYYINDQLQPDLSQKTEPPEGQFLVFFQGFMTGNTVNFANISLTAQPAKK